MEIENNVEGEVEAVGEQQCSAWLERGSSGKLKYGCKSYKLDLSVAVDDVFENFMKMEKIIKKSIEV